MDWELSFFLTRDQGFHELRVLETIPSLEGPPVFACFFPFFKPMFFFRVLICYFLWLAFYTMSLGFMTKVIGFKG